VTTEKRSDGRDWQDPDETAFDPDNPLALLEKAAAKEGQERTQEAIWALRSMLAAGADQGVIEAAREYAATSKVLRLGSFDRLVRDHEVTAGGGDRDDGRGPSIATQLAEIARELYAFGVSDLGEPFAIPREGPRVVAMLRGSKTSLRALLSREYFTRMGRVPTQQALTDALLVVEGFAQEQEPSRLFMRCAEHDGALWLDLGDQTGRAIRITARGWSVEDEAPVLFKRTALTGQLPEPKPGGSLEDLWTWLNVGEGDRPLIAAELVARLFSDVPHVVLAILGEHGTAKTTTTKILVSLLDPSPVTVRKPPRDMESWVTMAAGSWVVALDNLSDIPSWLSDSICRASTGDGDVRRRLYTDGDYAVFAFRRCVIFNGIDVGALATDLADRTLPIALQPITEADRRNEKAFWADWGDAHPKLLGALLTLAAGVLRRLPETTLDKTPRMADYALVLAAVDAILGTKALARYADQGKNLAAESLSDDPLAAAITRQLTGPFEGTAASLLKLVTPADSDWQPPKNWPNTARKVTGRLTRLAPAFRKTGWTVENLGSDNHDNVLHWHLSPPAQPETSREQTRQTSQPSQQESDQHEHGADSAREAPDARGEREGTTSQPSQRPDVPSRQADRITAGQEPSARDARIGEAKNGTSQVGVREGTAALACPRHQTQWGPHKDCLDCQSLAAGGPRHE
jgi:hypothetical protein